MSLVLYLLIGAGTFLAMEGVTWLTHKFVMHGFLWFLHEDHHKKGPGFFEKNDAFFIIFAIPSWLCIMLGSMSQAYWVVSIGFGIALYGLAYFVVHDIIIHQRFKIFTHSTHPYIKSIRWAHKMHHKYLEKEEGESFGMLLVGKKYRQKVKRDQEYQSGQKRDFRHSV
jgi:beta-carotene 3-hydroxylase